MINLNMRKAVIKKKQRGNLVDIFVEQMQCPNCEIWKIEGSFKFCPMCGVELEFEKYEL